MFEPATSGMREFPGAPCALLPCAGGLLSRAGTQRAAFLNLYQQRGSIEIRPKSREQSLCTSSHKYGRLLYSSSFEGYRVTLLRL